MIITILIFSLFGSFATLFLIHTVLVLHAFIVIERWRHEGLTGETAQWWQKWYLTYGIFMDVLYNYAPWGGSALMGRFPRRGETMFTYHLRRVRHEKLKTWAGLVTAVYCAILNHYDHNHCRDQT